MSAVALVPGRPRHTAAAAAEARELVEGIIDRSAFLGAAPFSWIGLTFRYGDRNQERPEYDAIDPEDGELPVAIEIDMKGLLGASREEVTKRILVATLRSVLDVGKRFDLPTSELEAALEAVCS